MPGSYRKPLQWDLRVFVQFLLICVCCDAAGLSPELRRLNVDSFEYVWKTVQDKHWDPKLGGVDWRAVHDELRPQVEAASTMDEARRVIGSMLDRLHQTHFGVIPSDAYDPAGVSDSGDRRGVTGGVTGIDVRIISNHAVVASVEPDSGAHDAGVRAGWEISTIGSAEVDRMISRIQNSTQSPRMAGLLAARAIRSRLDGAVDSGIPVGFIGAEGTRINKSIVRRMEPGETTQFGFLPPMTVRIDSRKLEGGAEYVRFNIFLKPDLLVPKFGEAVHECGRCPGVIIDLRGNPGGIGAMAMGMAGFLISKPDQKLGTMFMRTLRIRFTIFPRADVYDGPVAILVDAFTASTSEIFAGGLQDLKRARVFGERTAGAALPSQIEKLPNGDGFQYAVGNYVSESGRQLEGNGVVPDVDVPLERGSLLSGRDKALEAAVIWLRDNARNSVRE